MTSGEFPEDEEVTAVRALQHRAARLVRAWQALPEKWQQILELMAESEEFRLIFEKLADEVLRKKR